MVGNMLTEVLNENYKTMQQQYDGTATIEPTKGIWSSFGILCSTNLFLSYFGVKQGSLKKTQEPNNSTISIYSLPQKQNYCCQYIW